MTFHIILLRPDHVFKLTLPELGSILNLVKKSYILRKSMPELKFKLALIKYLKMCNPSIKNAIFVKICLFSVEIYLVEVPRKVLLGGSEVIRRQ